jgi:FKBP-type peptidyl-prolyl cis-trans isomerase FklB
MWCLIKMKSRKENLMRILAVAFLSMVAGTVNTIYAVEQVEVPGSDVPGTDLLKDDAARLNYSVGYQVGSDFKQQEFEVRPEAVLKGIEDALSGGDLLMTREEMRQTMADVGKRVADVKKQKRQQMVDYTEKNRQFLVENAKKPGIITTASGLQYRVMEDGRGKGEHPGLDSKVLVHYRGKLIDGTGFDSSRARGKPDYFQVNQVIKGWAEALQLMRQGDHWQLFVPAELAYGERGAGTSIPPNSTLIFDIELISVQQ